MNDIKLAREISKEAHKGQTRWDGSDYFNSHIEKVVEKVYDSRMTYPKQFQERDLFEALVCAAYLHDVVEDTQITLDDLSKDFSPYVLNILENVTRKTGESYYDFIMRIHGSSCFGSKIVKIADLKSNMDDTKEKSTRMYATYEFALYILTYLGFKDETE